SRNAGFKAKTQGFWTGELVSDVFVGAILEQIQNVLLQGRRKAVERAAWFPAKGARFAFVVNAVALIVNPNFQVLFRFIFRHKLFIFRKSAEIFRFSAGGFFVRL